MLSVGIRASCAQLRYCAPRSPVAFPRSGSHRVGVVLTHRCVRDKLASNTNTPPRAQSCSPLLLGGFFHCCRRRGRAFVQASAELVVYGGGSGVRLEVALSRDLDRVFVCRLRWGWGLWTSVSLSAAFFRCCGLVLFLSSLSRCASVTKPAPGLCSSSSDLCFSSSSSGSWCVAAGV